MTTSSQMTLSTSLKTTLSKLIDNELEVVQQSDSRALSLCLELMSLYACPFFSYEQHHEERLLTIRRCCIITYLCSSILKPVSHLSSNSAFWDHLVDIMIWVSQTPVHQRSLTRDLSGSLICLNTFSNVKMKWDAEKVEFDLFIISSHRGENSNLFQSIVIAQRAIHFITQEESLQQGIDLSGRCVTIRYPRNLLLSEMYDEIFEKPYAPSGIHVYGISCEQARDSVGSRHFMRSVLLEKPAGPYLRDILDAVSSLQQSEPIIRHLAFHIVKAITVLHGKRSCHGNLGLDTLFLDKAFIEDASILMDPRFLPTHQGLTSNQSLLKREFCLFYTHPYTYLLNKNRKMHSVESWLFKPFEMVKYMQNRYEVTDVVDFYQQIDKWSLGAILLTVFFPGERSFWVDLAQRMEKMSQGESVDLPNQQQLNAYIHDLFVKKYGDYALRIAKWEEVITGLLQIQPVKRITVREALKLIQRDFAV